MSVIVSIRATHGAGKSTIVRKILDKYPHEASMTLVSIRRLYAHRLGLL
jgi:uridine kinase